jgi:hypothetical protein
MNKDLLQAVISTLEDTRSIRNRISDINAQDSPMHVRLLLRSVFTHCDAVDSIVDEALARSCSVPITALPVEEDETDDRDLVLSGVLR